MTHDLAAALLRDVPRHTAQDAASMTTHGASVWLHEDAVLSALSHALDPALADLAAAEAKVEKLRGKIRDWETRIDVCEWSANTCLTEGIRGEMRAALTTEEPK